MELFGVQHAPSVGCQAIKMMTEVCLDLIRNQAVQCSASLNSGRAGRFFGGAKHQPQSCLILEEMQGVLQCSSRS